MNRHASQGYARTATSGLAVACALAAAVLLSGCSKHPAGPDVRGLNLVGAESALEKAGVAFTEHAKDAPLGILVKDNFVVCDVKYVSENMVRLEVAKHGC